MQQWDEWTLGNSYSETTETGVENYLINIINRENYTGKKKAGPVRLIPPLIPTPIAQRKPELPEEWLWSDALSLVRYEWMGSCVQTLDLQPDTAVTVTVGQTKFTTTHARFLSNAENVAKRVTLGWRWNRAVTPGHSARVSRLRGAADSMLFATFHWCHTTPMDPPRDRTGQQQNTGSRVAYSFSMSGKYSTSILLQRNLK